MPDIKSIWDRFCALRYLIVGGWNMVFGYGEFAFLYWLWGGTAAGDAVVQVVSNVIGITNAYLCHRFLTYRSTGVWWREYLRFYVVYGLEALFTMGMFFVFSTWLGYNGYAVEFVVTVALTVVTYWIHKFYSFRK